jgi:hypothetical protein
VDEQVPQSTLSPAEAERIAVATLGHTGALLHRSKTTYRQEHPLTVALFNATVLVETTHSGPMAIWWGDWNLSADHPKLRELADRLGGRVYLLRETDTRFVDKPRVENAVAWIDPGGGDVELNPKFAVRRHGQIEWRRTPLPVESWLGVRIPDADPPGIEAFLADHPEKRCRIEALRRRDRELRDLGEVAIAEIYNCLVNGSPSRDGLRMTLRSFLRMLDDEAADLEQRLQETVDEATPSRDEE